MRLVGFFRLGIGKDYFMVVLVFIVFIGIVFNGFENKLL